MTQQKPKSKPISNVALAIAFFVFAISPVWPQQPDFRATMIRCKTPRLVPDMGVRQDREVTLTIKNSTPFVIIVFGSRVSGNFDPGRYLLIFSNKRETWEYPNPDNAPTPWNSLSQIYKREHKLRPGKSLSFTRTFSSDADKAERFKATAYIRSQKSRKSVEIRSDEFTIDKCSE